MEMPPEALRRIADDRVVWLTTVSDSGVPVPTPVWFVADGDDLLVFSEPSAHKVHNIEQRPAVTLHFNSDAHGGQVVVITGRATLSATMKPSAAPGYLERYEASITGELRTTVDAIDATYNTEIRIRPMRVRSWS